MSVWLEILLIGLLLVANGIFAMGEIALVSARRARLRQLAAEGKKGAASAWRLAGAPNRFLPTVQLGVTLVGLMAGAISGATLAEQLAEVLRRFPSLEAEAEAIALGIIVLILTFCSVVIGELVPKQIALAAPETIACRMARFIEWLSWVASPLVKTLSATTNLLLRWLRVRPRAASEVSEEEVQLLLREGAAAGVFHRDEPGMVDSVQAFDRTPLSKIMTPRGALCLLRPEDSLAGLVSYAQQAPHADYPVVGGDDQLLGVVSLKTALPQLLARSVGRVGELMQEPLLVSPNDSVSDFLARAKKTGRHAGMVCRSDRRLLGIVTLVDVLEVVIGKVQPLPKSGHDVRRETRRGKPEPVPA